MSRKATYPTPWLDCRFPFDVRARHAATEAAMLADLPLDRPVRLVDLGCGNGANIRHLWQRISASQHWTLIDQDVKLLTAALAGMEELGEAAGYLPDSTGSDKLTLRKGDHVVKIQTRHTSLLEVAEVVSLAETDVVMANAVFDLFSELQTDRVLSTLWPHTAIFLTLNYTGMEFAPSHPDDGTVIGWYESHMQRPQAFGQGMGADGPAMIEAWIQKHDGAFQFGDSVWEILPHDTEMLSYLLGFMEEAIPELPLSQDELDVLNNWLAVRGAQLDAGTLYCKVFHRDQWASRV